MKRKVSLILSATIMLSILSSLGVSGRTAYADEVDFETEEILDENFVKYEDISSSIPRENIPENNEIFIQKFENVKEVIEKDLKTTISIPENIDNKMDAINGKLSKGVGVALYRLAKENYESGKVKLSKDILISDPKFSISSENGDFSIKFDKKNLNNGDHIGICISYPSIDNSGNDIHKTFVIDSVYTQEDNNELEKNRISGSNRYKTNIESIRRSYVVGSTDTVIIVSGENFADALAAGPVSMKNGYPVLFSGKRGLSEEALKLIKDYSIKKAIIVGGKKSVVPAVDSQISNLSLRRISGSDRYDTSRMLLSELGNSKHVIITDGRDFADALSATPLAKKLNSPILLVEKFRDIPKDLDKYNDVYIVGGKSSVSNILEKHIEDIMRNKKVYRVYGKDRMMTSYQVAKLIKYDENVLANGKIFADALSSINLMNGNGKNLLLIGEKKIPDYMSDIVKNHQNYIIGGYSTIAKGIL